MSKRKDPKDFKKNGRPTKYTPKLIKLVDEYLLDNQDEEVEVVKQRNDEKGYEMYDHKLKVRLPTVEGFARYVDISKKTLYEYEAKYPMFLNALDKIRIEQKERLLNMGLSGEYNSTIAKLILSSNHGMSEKTDLEVKGSFSLFEVLKKVDGK